MALFIELMKKCFILLVVGMTTISWGQNGANYALFPYQMNFVNPAYAGAQEVTSIQLSSRNQWVSIENAPKVTSFAASTPYKNNLGLGLNVLNSSIFVEQKTVVSADASYKLVLSESSQLYLGLRGGGYFYNVDPLSLTTYGGVSDPSQQAQTSFTPVIGMGAYWKNENFWLSYSIPQLIKLGKLDAAVNSAILVQHYLAAGATFPIGGSLSLKPAFIVRKIGEQKPYSQFSGALAFQESVELGASYLTAGAAAVTGLVRIGSFLDVGYAYETSTKSRLGGLKNQTHEFFVHVKLGAFSQSTSNSETIDTPDEGGDMQQLNF